MMGVIAIVVLTAGLAVSICFNYRQSLVIDELRTARHAKPRERGASPAALPDGPVPADVPAGAGPAARPWVSSALLTSGELAELDARVDVFLPRRQSPSRADLPVVRRQTADHAPWTGELPRLDEAALDRQEYIAGYLREHGATEAAMCDAMAAARMRDANALLPAGHADTAEIPQVTA